MSAALMSLAERVERAAWEDLFAAAPPASVRQLGLSLSSLGDTLQLRASGVDSVLFNRVIGLGSSEPATVALVHSVLGRFSAGAIGRFFVHLTNDAGPAELPAWLAASGLAPYARRWAKFVRTTAAPLPHARLPVRIAKGPQDARTFGRLIATGFELPEAVVPVIGTVVDRPGWSVHFACEGDRVLGAGALFVRGRAGYLAMAATLPEERGRGAQAAIIAERLREAATLGCEVVFSETGEAVLGQPNHSWANLERAGFTVLALRENWAPVGMRSAPSGAAPRGLG